MDEEEFEFTVFEIEPQARRLRPLDFAVIGLDFIRGVSQAVTDSFEQATALVAMHCNYQIQREEFHEQATLEIETITGEVDG